MPQDNVTRCLGLITQSNPLHVQTGALVKAENAVIGRDDVVENRRGYALYMSLANAPLQHMAYMNRILVHNGTIITYDSDGAGTPLNYSGSYTAPSGRLMRFAEDKSNLYITTDAGIKVLMDVSGTAARNAGSPRSLDPSYVLNAAGTGFLSNGNQTAYRCVIVKVDQNGNTLFGYPSQRLWVTNASGTSKNVDLTVYIPTEVVAGDTLQFYRTSQVVGTTSDSAGEEMGLVYQYTVVAGDITNKFVTFTDSITDALIGASLYTSPSQEGIAQANDRPPLSKDLAFYRSQFMFYANTTTKQRLNVTMVGTTNLYNGGTYNRTVIIAGTTYTSKAAENFAAGEFKVFNSGVAANDIDNTARSLVAAINRYSTNTSVYAYYQSGANTLPGQMLIEERGLGASVFGISVGNAAVSADFYPNPPTSPPTSGLSASSNDVKKNRLYYSKAGQSEAVPTLNFIDVGPSNRNILRILALRDSLIIIKDEGIYRLTGEVPQNFSIVPLDLTVFCKAPDSAAALANRIYMISNQGIVAISDTGVEVVSRDIDPNIQPIIQLTNLSANTYGVSYESDRQYLISTVASSGDAGPTQTFIYNVFTKAWTKWTFGFTSGIVESSADKVYFAKTSNLSTFRERKSFTSSDYADPESAITISSINVVSGNVVFTVTGSAVPKAGWKISQGSTAIRISTVSQLVSLSYSAYLASNIPSSWTTGAATLFPSIDFAIEWDAWTAGEPGYLKQVREIKILTDNISGNNSVSSLRATFRTDLDASLEEVTINSNSFGWGSMPWGSSPWSGRSEVFDYRTYPTQRKQYCRVMNAGVKHSIANEKISLNGIAYTFEMISERTTR